MDFLGRAREVLRGWGPAEPPKPQSYHVACAAGHRLHGGRVDGYQALRCPTCGDGIFVLPRSPLPDPPAPVPRDRDRSRRVATSTVLEDGPIPLTDPPPPDLDEADAEVEWLEPDEDRAPEPTKQATGSGVAFDVEEVLADEVEPASEPTRAGPRPATRPEPKPRPGRDPRSSAPRPVPSRRARPTRPTVIVPERAGLGDWAGRHRHLLLFLGVAVLVAATVGVEIRRQGRQALPGIVEAGRREGLPALDAGQFDLARRTLAEAARAVESLGGAVEGADDVVQGAREAAIFVDLVPASLEEIVAEAARAEDDAAWRDRFEALYKGRSVLLDGRAADYRILSRSGIRSDRVGRLQTEGFPLLGGDRPAENVIGARLASVGLVEGEWLVGLDPDSGVIMTHWEALRAFGWPVEGDGSEREAPH